MRRLLIALTATTLLLASCGGDDGGGELGSGEVDADACPVDALDDADGPVEVVLWNTFTAEPLRTATELVAEYNDSQDRVVVRLENQGVTYEEIQRQFNTAIRSDDLPGLVHLEDTQTQFMADSGVIVPAEACAEADGYDLDRFLPVVRSYYSVDEVLQPAASNLSTAVMYYNQDHFREAGLDPEAPPETLAELRTAAEALAEAGVSETPFVMVLQPWYIEHWLVGAGQTIVNNDNGRDGLAIEGTFDNPTTLEIYEWLQEMADDGLLRPVPGTEGQIDHLFAMALEQSSITIETSTAIATINAVLEGTADVQELGLDDLGFDELPPIEIDVGVAAYPGVEAAGQVQPGGGVFYIPSTSAPEVIAAAWDFMKWYNDATTQVEWSQGSSYLPWNTEAIESPELQSFWTDTRPGRWTSVSYRQVEAFDPEFPGPLIGPYTEVRTAIRNSLDAVLLGNTTPADAIATANSQITDALEIYEDDF
ncbi:MAG: ABC transporter substrate-binding protein [Acidimicrobiia bacterium]|nr:ABC transporter substrate-binding protein [Acidimicrobiia bacterium]